MLGNRDGLAPRPAPQPRSCCCRPRHGREAPAASRGDSTSIPMGCVPCRAWSVWDAPSQQLPGMLHVSFPICRVRGRRGGALSRGGSQGTLRDLTAQGVRSTLTPTRALPQPSGSCKSPTWCEARWFRLCATLDSTAGRARCRGTVRNRHESEVEI